MVLGHFPYTRYNDIICMRNNCIIIYLYRTKIDLQMLIFWFIFVSPL